MSVPFNIFSCSQCDLSGTDLVTAGFFSYRDGDAEASIPRSCGYCAVCDSIVAVETLTVRRSDWHAEIAQGKHVESEGNDLPRRWWHRLFARLLPPPGARAATLSELAKAEERFVSQIAEIGRAPVCLRCGAEGIIALPLPADFVDDGSLFRVGGFHPGCGGEFVVHGSNGVRLQPELAERIFDWRTGRRISGPDVEIEPPLVSGFWPGERPQTRPFEV